MMTVNLTNVMHMYLCYVWVVSILDNFMHGYLCVRYNFRVMHLFVELDMDCLHHVNRVVKTI